MHPVDEPGGDGAHADVAARLHASLAAPGLDPAVRQRHLRAIRARAAALPTPAPAPAVPRPTPARAPAAPTAAPTARAPAGGGWARRLASTVSAAGLVVVLGASGAVAASHDALPGQALYGVKEVSERLVLAAPLPAGVAVDRHLAFADRRLDEAGALVDAGRDPALVADALAAHARLMERAGALAGEDRELAGRVEAAALVARDRLTSLLEGGLPDVAADQARAALTAVHERLDRQPGTPATPTPPAAPPRGSGAPGGQPAPATPPDPTPGPPADPGRPGEPGPPQDPGSPATPRPPANPGPPDNAGRPERTPRQPPPGTPSSGSGRQPAPATPREQSPTPGPRVTPSEPPDERGGGHGRDGLLPAPDRLPVDR